MRSSGLFREVFDERVPVLRPRESIDLAEGRDRLRLRIPCARTRTPSRHSPHRRRETMRTLARALAEGEIVAQPSSDREEVRSRLLAIEGIGPWTADYVAMRALADPDAFTASDLGVRRALEGLKHRGDHHSATALAARWRPWRAYAVQHLWASLRGAPAQ